MTTLDYRPAPTTINGEVLDVTVHPIPSNPHRWPVIISAGLTMGTALALLVNIDADGGSKAVSFGCFLLAVALLLVTSIRHNAFAEVNDPFWKP